MIKQLIYSLKRPYHFVKTGLLQGLPAELKYSFPAKKLHITTITGTDGKTTSSTLLYHVLKTSGYRVGLLSTVAAYFGDEAIDTGFHVTSPQPKDMHEFMRKMVDKQYSHLVMEVTSHGEYQYRTWGVTPSLAGITNVAHEHLDYHLTPEGYLNAKAAILKKSPIVALNADDPSYHKLRRTLSLDHTILPYSASDSLPRKIKQAMLNRFPEQYNQMNARLVYVLARQIGVRDHDFALAVTTFAGISGRMEEVKTNKQYTVIVDFAHTPQGLYAVLTALRERLKLQKIPGRLIAIGGCAGLRDFSKRPKMGKIATDLADLVVFTSEDPRTENIWSIIRQMKEQLTENHHKIVSIADRRAAITFALTKLAKRGDIIVIFGKGHEKSMCYGTKEYPWSDQIAVKEITSE